MKNWDVSLLASWGEHYTTLHPSLSNIVFLAALLAQALLAALLVQWAEAVAEARAVAQAAAQHQRQKPAEQ
jgi:hypothetical protein